MCAERSLVLQGLVALNTSFGKNILQTTAFEVESLTIEGTGVQGDNNILSPDPEHVKSTTGACTEKSSDVETDYSLRFGG